MDQMSFMNFWKKSLSRYKFHKLEGELFVSRLRDSIRTEVKACRRMHRCLTESARLHKARNTSQREAVAKTFRFEDGFLNKPGVGGVRVLSWRMTQSDMQRARGKVSWSNYREKFVGVIGASCSLLKLVLKKMIV